MNQQFLNRVGYPIVVIQRKENTTRKIESKHKRDEEKLCCLLASERKKGEVFAQLHLNVIFNLGSVHVVLTSILPFLTSQMSMTLVWTSE